MKSFDVGLVVVGGVGKVTGEGELIVVKSFAVGLAPVGTAYERSLAPWGPSHERNDSSYRSSVLCLAYIAQHSASRGGNNGVKVWTFSLFKVNQLPSPLEH